MNSIEDLKNESIVKNLTVRWTVLSAIGPEWIGSRRTITFYLGELPVEESDIQQFLTDRLIEVMGIPETSEYHVLRGEGTFELKDSELIIHYETEANIPYDVDFNYEDGQAVFLKFN